MRRLAMLMLLVGAILTTLAADGYNSRQELLRSQIENYLKRDGGYSVESRSDGLKFNNDGVNYYIEISDKDTNPMYVRLCRYIKFDNTVKRDEIMEQLNDLNNTYTVKVYCKEKNVIVATDMFVTSAAQFNTAFPEMLKLLNSVSEKIIQ